MEFAQDAVGRDFGFQAIVKAQLRGKEGHLNNEFDDILENSFDSASCHDE